MQVSLTHERGRAAEHLVVADLILQGVPAVLTGAAWPHDVIAQLDGRLLRVQVKATFEARSLGRAKDVYRFNLKHGGIRVKDKRISASDVDVLAFVALDIRKIAYFTIEQMTARTGHMKQTVDLRHSTHHGRRYSSGKVRLLEWHQTFHGHEDFKALWPQQAEAQVAV